MTGQWTSETYDGGEPLLTEVIIKGTESEQVLSNFVLYTILLGFISFLLNPITA